MLPSSCSHLCESAAAAVASVVEVRIKLDSLCCQVVLSWLEEEEKASAGRYREANAKGAPVDLKLCEYKHGDKFAHNRMHNRTC